jgi:hypothetical protein
MVFLLFSTYESLYLGTLVGLVAKTHIFEFFVLP